MTYLPGQQYYVFEKWVQLSKQYSKSKCYGCQELNMINECGKPTQMKYKNKHNKSSIVMDYESTHLSNGGRMGHKVGLIKRPSGKP